MAEEIQRCQPREGETPKGVAEQIEAASANLFKERICVAIFMAPLFWRCQTHEMDILGPEAKLVQQHSVGRYVVILFAAIGQQ